MKTNPICRVQRLFAKYLSMLVTTATFAVAIMPAESNAGLVFHVDNVGSDVVTSFSGTLTISPSFTGSDSGLKLWSTDQSGINGGLAQLAVGPGYKNDQDWATYDFFGAITPGGPSSFGITDLLNFKPDFSSGPNQVGILPVASSDPELAYTLFMDTATAYYITTPPLNPYILSGSSTYTGRTIATMFLTPGIYQWSVGKQFVDDTIVLCIGSQSSSPCSQNAVPEPSSMALILPVLLGLFGFRSRRRSSQRGH